MKTVLKIMACVVVVTTLSFGVRKLVEALRN